MKSKMATSHGSGLQSPPPIGRPVDRVFEEAQFTGEIHLNGRKLRDYPKLCSKYDLSDTIIVDISRNRLAEVPYEVCEYLYVERINCYHNVIRSIPDAIQQLQALTHLSLSRNQLSVLPTALCMLSALEVLTASNNKLVSLPEEIGELKSLMDLDVSCNEISYLPPQIGDLSSLRCLNIRKNFLVELPLEISRLQLYRLDFSSNRIERIPTVFRKMETLEQFILDHNPLSSPPAYICTKGRQHIMKYLQIEAVKEDRKRGILMSSDSDVKRFVRKSLPPQQPSEDFKNMLGAPESKWKRHTVLSNDSGYSTGDGAERNGWQSGEIYPLNEESDGGETAHQRDSQSHHPYYHQQPPYQHKQYPTGGPSSSLFTHLSRSRSGSGLYNQMVQRHSQLEQGNTEPVKPGRVSPNPAPASYPQYHHQVQHSQRTYPQDSSQPTHRPPPHPYSYPSASSPPPNTSNPNVYAPSPSLSNRRAGALSPAGSTHSQENQNPNLNNSFSGHNNSFSGSESGSVHVRQWSNTSLPEYSPRSHPDLGLSQRTRSPRVSAGYRSDSSSSHYGYNKSSSMDYSNSTSNSQSALYSGHRQTSLYGGQPHSQSNQLEQVGNRDSPPMTPPTPPIIMAGNMEDEFTRELKRQKAEYERKKKQAELIRVQQEEEEEREREERRRAAVKLQEEQKAVMEKLEEQRKQEEVQRQEAAWRQQEAARLKEQEEHRKKEEEKNRQREEELKRLQETVRIPDGEDKIRMRGGGEQQKRTESKLVDKNMTNNYHRNTNTSTHSSSRPQQPPPPPPKSSSATRPYKPPSSLPVHGFSGPLSPSSSLSSASPSSSSSSFIKSPQQRQQGDSNYILSENEYRNVVSSQSFKEQRRLANSTQYRRTTSDTLKKPGQPSTPQHQVDNLNYINRNGVVENSRQSSTSTTPSVSPSPSPRNSVSHLAKPNSPSSSTSHLAKPISPSGSTSHLAKPTGTKSSVPRANGSTAAAQNQAMRRTKAAGDRSNTASPVTARSSRSTGTSNLRPQGSGLNPAAANLRRSSNSSTTDDDAKPKKGPSTPTETSRLKSRLEEQNKRGAHHPSGVKKPETTDNNRRINTRPPTNMYGSGRGRSGGTKALEDTGSNFTVRRREEQQREEAEQMDRLRQTVESRLRVTLPDNLAEALRDGVVLCHLANQIRPRSVGSIHVPSPAVPKLTLAKCRRNVDNFLDACRKIGVDQEQICGPQDIFDEKGISRVAITVAALVAIGTNPKQSAV